MKNKKLLIVLLLIFVLPVMVNAKTCKNISSNDNKLGDEIVCGSEHFYIIENKDGVIKMLSKYNLYVGDKIEKDTESFKLEDYDGNDNAAYEATLARCSVLGEELGDDDRVDSIAKFSFDGYVSEYFCRIFTPLEYDEVKQSEIAIGLFPNGNMEVAYPIYGAVYIDEEVKEHEFDDNLDMVLESSKFNTYLNGYKTTLSGLGVNVLDIGFIKKSGVESFINSVSDKKITIPTYSPETDVYPDENKWQDELYNDYEIGASKINLVEYVPSTYKWLYGTTYWTGSATVERGDGWADYFDEFISTVGDYCSYGRGCPQRRIGVGIRPVVSINSDEIINDIKVNPETGTFIPITIIASGLLVAGTILIATKQRLYRI